MFGQLYTLKCVLDRSMSKAKMERSCWDVLPEISPAASGLRTFWLRWWQMKMFYSGRLTLKMFHNSGLLKGWFSMRQQLGFVGLVHWPYKQNAWSGISRFLFHLWFWVVSAAIAGLDWDQCLRHCHPSIPAVEKTHKHPAATLDTIFWNHNLENIPNNSLLGRKYPLSDYESVSEEVVASTVLT